MRFFFSVCVFFSASTDVNKLQCGLSGWAENEPVAVLRAVRAGIDHCQLLDSYADQDIRDGGESQ